MLFEIVHLTCALCATVAYWYVAECYASYGQRRLVGTTDCGTIYIGSFGFEICGTTTSWDELECYNDNCAYAQLVRGHIIDGLALFWIIGMCLYHAYIWEYTMRFIRNGSHIILYGGWIGASFLLMEHTLFVQLEDMNVPLYNTTSRRMEYVQAFHIRTNENMYRTYKSAIGDMISCNALIIAVLVIFNEYDKRRVLLSIQEESLNSKC